MKKKAEAYFSFYILHFDFFLNVIDSQAVYLALTYHPG